MSTNLCNEFLLLFNEDRCQTQTSFRLTFSFAFRLELYISIYSSAVFITETRFNLRSQHHGNTLPFLTVALFSVIVPKTARFYFWQGGLFNGKLNLTPQKLSVTIRTTYFTLRITAWQKQTIYRFHLAVSISSKMQDFKLPLRNFVFINPPAYSDKCSNPTSASRKRCLHLQMREVERRLGLITAQLIKKWTEFVKPEISLLYS